jgi:ABC-type sugar transport system ATPase subunit
MPTIVLQHVTKRLDSEKRDETGLNRVVTNTSRSIFDDRMGDYLHQLRPIIEPPDRENALDDLSLTIRNGETISILGPSGCGKTTLLKVIAGLIEQDSGEVLYDGIPVRSLSSDERGIGMVFQSYALFPHMQARENIGFYDLIRRRPERIPERIHHIVDVMGIDVKHLLNRKPPTLSGGEKQRVAVARCLARDPKVFLFDEPLSNLDAKLRVSTRVQIKRLLSHYQITSVYVTHDQTEAITLGDRIAIMRAGQIEQVGTFQALYNTPVNAFVAQFFGSPAMNLFAGYASGSTWQGRGFDVSPIRPYLREGQAVLLGIRPEHIQLADNGIPARVEHVEPLATERRKLLYLNIAGQPCVVSVAIDKPIPSPVYLQFSTQNLYLFDEKTGGRIG